MLTVPARPSRTCEGWSRREWLRVGGLSTLGLGLDQLYNLQRIQAAPEQFAESFGRAKACIVLFMFGAPAHQDIWDMKPQAPLEARGEFQPIHTNVEGITVCEHLPRLSQHMDKLAQIRSVTHPDNTHTVAMHYMLSGVRHRRPKTNPQNAGDDFPCYGAVLNSLRHQGKTWHGTRSVRDVLPASVSLNAPANQVSANNHIFPGFFAGFLGNAHDPLFVPRNANIPQFDPFPTLGQPGRLLDRQRLLELLDDHRRRVESSARVKSLGSEYDRAFSLLTAPSARRAFRLDEEPAALRARYGNTPFGQACLLARRLVESGISLVTVNWERDEGYTADDVFLWDTHKDNFGQLRRTLLPSMDRGFSTLLEDLQQRGMLDETLIVWLGEFGRSPQINRDAGREHWAPCNTVLLAGAGVPGGFVHGASDRTAAAVAKDPVYPEDLSATIYHLLGVNPHHLIHDHEGRPHPLSAGQIVRSMV